MMASYIMFGIKGTTKDILERNSLGSSTSQSLTYCSLQVMAIATLRWESTGGLGGGVGAGGSGERGAGGGGMRGCMSNETGGHVILERTSLSYEHPSKHRKPKHHN